MSDLQAKPIWNDEIDLKEIWFTIWGGRTLIVCVVLITAICAAGISLMMPNIYRAEVLIAPVSDDASKGAGNLGQLGGLASLAGIQMGSSTSVDENLAVLQSRTFLWTFIQENNLMPILFQNDWDISKKAWKELDSNKQPNVWDAYRKFRGLITVDKDKKNNLITVAVEWTNSELAADWTNELVACLNEHLRQQTIQRSQENLKYLGEALDKTQLQEVRQSLFGIISQEQKQIMIASTQKEFAFKVIDGAIKPDNKIKPKRALIAVIGGIFGLFVSFLIIWVRKHN